MRIPPTITNLDPTIAIPERFVEFADDYFSRSPSTRPRSVWVDQFRQYESTGYTGRRPFSLLSWNILAQALYEGGGTNSGHKIAWPVRLEWILGILKDANADIVCLQEVQDDDVFRHDLWPAMKEWGYDGVVQGGVGVREIKRRRGKGDRAIKVATFWKRDLFQPAMVLPENVNSNKKKKKKKKTDQMMAHMARGRTLTSLLQPTADGGSDEATLAVVNCHLEGHPNQYAARIRQLQHALDDLATRVDDPPNAYNGLVIAGDFNCELSSSACSTYLRIGRVGRKGGLGGLNGPACLAVPPSILQSDEAAEVLSPILEWGQALPNQEMESVKPHPFRRNSLVSAYPPKLDANVHFTYCAKPFRPVSGLDQIWYSSLSLQRMALRRASSPTARNIILQTGLPEGEVLNQPSDHLPVGAVFEWNSCNPQEECSLEGFEDDDENDDGEPSCRRPCSDAGVRSLIVVPNQEPPTPKPISPIMAYAELDLLLSTGPFDSPAQQAEVESIVDETSLPSNKDEKPSEEEIVRLREMRDRKKVLLQGASDSVRPTLQRILKLKKEVCKYEEEMFGFA